MIGNAFALLSLVDNVFQDADNGYICFIILWNFYKNIQEIYFLEAYGIFCLFFMLIFLIDR